LGVAFWGSRVGRWFIDDSGEVLAEGARELSDPGAMPADAQNIRDYLIDAAGFVHVEQRRRLTKVRFARGTVQRDALIGLMHFLASHEGLIVSFEHPDSPGAIPLMNRRTQWIAYVQVAIDARANDTGFQSWDLPIGLSPFATRWRGGAEICAMLEGAQRLQLLDVLFDGAFILTRRSGEDGRHRFVAMGHRHRSFDPEFYDTAPGRVVTEGHDTTYARWVMASYDEAQRLGKPLAEDIDARITFPGRSRELYRYSRVRIPVLRDDGQHLTLSAVTTR
jgi:hypothetical protein